MCEYGGASTVCSMSLLYGAVFIMELAEYLKVVETNLEGIEGFEAVARKHE